jgi:hypothetical protein
MRTSAQFSLLGQPPHRRFAHHPPDLSLTRRSRLEWGRGTLSMWLVNILLQFGRRAGIGAVRAVHQAMAPTRSPKA